MTETSSGNREKLPRELIDPLGGLRGRHRRSFSDGDAGVAVNTSHLYWTGDGSIWEADWPDGDNPHPIVTGQRLPVGVAVGPQ
jgi:hypothetical protein